MANVGFGITQLDIVGLGTPVIQSSSGSIEFALGSGTPTIESPNILNLNAVTVAISTNATVGGILTATSFVKSGGTSSQYLMADGTTTTGGGGGGTPLKSRTTVTGTTASIANNVSDNISITAHKSYSLLKIKPSIAAWVVLYVDAASRTADASRIQGVDPAPDAGVIAEVVTTTANEEIKMSPGVLGWHQDGGGDAVTTVFCKVVNKSGSTSTCTVSLTVVQLEA